MRAESGQSCEYWLDACGDALFEKIVVHIGCNETKVASRIHTSSAYRAVSPIC